MTGRLVTGISRLATAKVRRLIPRRLLIRIRVLLLERPLLVLRMCSCKWQRLPSSAAGLSRLRSVLIIEAALMLTRMKLLLLVGVSVSLQCMRPGLSVALRTLTGLTMVVLLMGAVTLVIGVVTLLVICVWTVTSVALSWFRCAVATAVSLVEPVISWFRELMSVVLLSSD